MKRQRLCSTIHVVSYFVTEFFGTYCLWQVHLRHIRGLAIMQSTDKISQFTKKRKQSFQELLLIGSVLNWAFLTWLQSSSIRELTAPWIVFHWYLLFITLSILSKSISVHWMMSPNHVVFGFPRFLFPDKVPWVIFFSKQLCLMMWPK